MSLFSKTIPICRSARQIPVRFYSKVGILGIPFGHGQRKEGVGLGPKAIRSAGLVKELVEIGVNAEDLGDVAYTVTDNEASDSNSGVIALNHVAACHKQISVQVKKMLEDGYSCLCLGGDHSIAVGTIDGHLKVHPDAAVLWIDAHADLNTAATSPTGNAHGMPLGMLLKELAAYWPVLPGMDWLLPSLSTKNVAYIGLRDVDTFERLLIEKHNITAYNMNDVDKFGIHELIRMALKQIDPDNNRSLHLSFDVDALDPSETPSTGTRVRGGLSLREGIKIVEDVYLTGRLRVMDVVELNPMIGEKTEAVRTVEAATLLIKAAFGSHRRGASLPKDVTEIPMSVPKRK